MGIMKSNRANSKVVNTYKIIMMMVDDNTSIVNQEI